MGQTAYVIYMYVLGNHHFSNTYVAKYQNVDITKI